MLRTSELQARLFRNYERWKGNFDPGPLVCRDFSPPLLLGVPNSFTSTKLPTVVFGQETYGWSWNRTLRTEYPAYPYEYMFRDQNTLEDFFTNEDAIEALCWGYEQFDFGMTQSIRSPFWRAFRSLNTAGNVLWSNVVKCDYQGGSILQLEPPLRDYFLKQQQQLIREELEALTPKAVIFFTGPNYDFILREIFPGLSFNSAFGEDIKISKLSHEKLPPRTFRTYHPNYLSRSGNWNHVERIASLIGE